MFFYYLAESQSELALATQFREQASAEGGNIGLTEFNTPIENRVMSYAVVWRGVVVEKAINVIEPKDSRIVSGSGTSDALNVTLAQVAGGIRNLFWGCAEVRWYQFW